MKRHFKTILFVVILSLTTVYSKTISKKVIKGYSNCIAAMANNTSGQNYF